MAATLSLSFLSEQWYFQTAISVVGLIYQLIILLMYVSVLLGVSVELS
jgi:hypothetical protein